MTTSLERLEELLVEEAVEELSEGTRQELEQLLLEHPEVDRYAFQRAAAVVFLSVADAVPAQLPRTLRERILAEGEQLVQKSDEFQT